MRELERKRRIEKGDEGKEKNPVLGKGGDKRNAGACSAVFHHSTAFHFIPVGTPRTPVFPPLWVRTLLSARPAEARPNPSTSSVRPPVYPEERKSHRESERDG